MSFSNKDTAPEMASANGVWGATWTPGTVKTAQSSAAAAPGVLTNSASYVPLGQISPGSWVSIFGDRMADGMGLSNQVPFPTALNGTQVTLGDVVLPVLFVSATQVNALIPYSLTASANHPLLVQRNGTSSVPLDVTVADVLPAIYTANQQGTGQGAILIANTGLLAAPVGAFPGSRPVKRGEFLEIYAGGLGPVAVTPADGAAASAGATMVLTPTVTIGGVPVTAIPFAGLVGLYQVNVQVPDAGRSATRSRW